MKEVGIKRNTSIGRGITFRVIHILPQFHSPHKPSTHLFLFSCCLSHTPPLSSFPYPPLPPLPLLPSPPLPVSITRSGPVILPSRPPLCPSVVRRTGEERGTTHGVRCVRCAVYYGANANINSVFFLSSFLSFFLSAR